MDPALVRLDRLRATTTLSGEALERWTAATLAVVGVGAVGGQFAREAVRSGARCDLFDFDVGSPHNLGNQDVRVGEPKAESVARLCNAIAPGSARARVIDVRHVGPGSFEDVAVIVDCSDDPALALPLTELSNGWGVPLLRLAVDGTGRHEQGRVLVSDGGRGGACQLCASSWTDVFDPGARAPCTARFADRPATNAGSALAMAVAGIGLLCAQRLVGLCGVDRIRDAELIVDLDGLRILPMRLRRSETCLSGHRRWSPVRLHRTAAETTVAELVALAEEALAGGASPAGAERLEPVGVSVHGHPLLPLVACSACGHGEVHPGTHWSLPPACRRCGGEMSRRRDVVLTEILGSQLEPLNIADVSCDALGLPTRGALVVARAPDHPPVQLLFD
jgi:hypothetical protein